MKFQSESVRETFSLAGSIVWILLERAVINV
jgi:hypothetical protein